MNDYFEAEELILERLGTEIPTLRLVQGARDISGVQSQTGTTPALHVIYDGQETRMGAGNLSAVDQLWMTVIAVRNRRDASNGRGERQEAGPLLLQTCQALLGWCPGTSFGAMKMATAPAPVFTHDLALFPLRFATRLILKGE
ncbi:MAG: hypothetical protein H7839_12610 [Magnetococcus sp. YQC-5]